MFIAYTSSSSPLAQARQPGPAPSTGRLPASTAPTSSFSQALDEIGSALEKDMAKLDGPSTMSADAINSRVQELISGELNAGKLTRDQADALNDLLSFQTADEADLAYDDAGDDLDANEIEEPTMSVADFLKRAMIPSALQSYSQQTSYSVTPRGPLLLDFSS